MIQIDDKIVSLDLLEERFHCNLSECRGLCCVLGDSGAPLEQQEAASLESELDRIEPFMTSQGTGAVRAQGVSVVDSDGDLVTPLIADGEECVFTISEGDISFCAIERAWEKGEISFRKPISCHLYPIRIKKYPDFTAVNYNRWEICNPARELGKEQGVPVYKFLKEAIVRVFGFEFYSSLEEAASYIESTKHSKE